MKIAIIGSGISGNAAAWLLVPHHDVHIFEALSYSGGHSNTVSVPGYPDVDTGFIVYNEATYPNLIALFAHLGVDVDKTDMSFSVSLESLEYSGEALFAQKRNLLKPSYYRMLWDVVRFYKTAPEILDSAEEISLGDYLTRNHYSRGFTDHHILPMAAAIWSTDSDDIRAFPARSFVQFFVNHGLFKFKNRPQWFTVRGGSKNYVAKLTADFKDKIRLNTPIRKVERFDEYVLVDGERFDQVIFACHTDQTLSILSDADNAERAVLEAFPYAKNTAYLHTDESLMPRRKKVWSSWNYLSSSKRGVALTYWMNRLQPHIGKAQNLFVTLNPARLPDPDKTLKVISYAHPQFTQTALKGWASIKDIQGKNRTWFCGAWAGYGFHEDGLSSGLAVAEALAGIKRPWNVQEKSPAGKNCTP